MDLAEIVLWGILIVPLVSLFFIKHSAFKRFSGVAILSCLIVSLVMEAADTLGWFEVGRSLFEWSQTTNISLTFGLFFAGTVWVFYLTFDRPVWVYFLVNASLEAFYAFFARKFVTDLGIVKGGTLEPLHIFLIMFLTAIIIYLYQRWVDSIMIKPKKEIYIKEIE